MSLTFALLFYIELLLIQWKPFVTCGVIDWSKHKPSICSNHDNFSLDISNGPLNVKIRLLITDVYDINEEKMQFGMQTFFTEYWIDPSLKLDDVNLKISEKVPDHVRQCIWMPDIIFPNCKESHLFSETLPNTYLKIKPNKHLHRHSRYKFTVSCNMEFYNYPMDVQHCALQIAFMSTRSDEALLTWVDDEKKSISFFDIVKPLSFSLKILEPTVKNHVFQQGVNYTRLFCNFAFERSIKSALVNTYIPSFLVVGLSWVSFWLDATAIPGRVTLGVTALLTLATEIVHARSTLPSLDYMTAMDIWLFGCLIMVFMSLLEFTVAQAWTRKGLQIEAAQEKSRKPLEAWRNAIATIKDNKIVDSEAENKMGRNYKVPDSDNDILSNLKEDNGLDRLSRVLFPSAMITFTSIYWAYFLFKRE